MQCHLALKAQMQNFLVFIQQYHDTHSQTDSSSPDQNHASDVIYLQAAIYRYFANTYCTPMTPDTHWYHHIWWSNLQKVSVHECPYYSSNGRQPPNDEQSTVLTPSIMWLVPWPIPTAPIKPLFMMITSAWASKYCPSQGPWFLIALCGPHHHTIPTGTHVMQTWLHHYLCTDSTYANLTLPSPKSPTLNNLWIQPHQLHLTRIYYDLCRNKHDHSGILVFL